MVESLLADVRQHVAQSSKHIDHAREVVQDTCDDAMDHSQRAFRKGRRIILNFGFDAERALQKNPIPAVTTALAVGLAVGFLTGWFVSRRD